MRGVLSACVVSEDGVIAVADLVTSRVAFGQETAVARASISRLLRSLWRLGYVELPSAPDRPEASDRTFSTARKSAQRYLAMAESVEDYRRVRRFRKDSGEEVPTRAEYRDEYRHRGRRPEVRARWVAITEPGRARAVNFVTRSIVNRSRTGGATSVNSVGAETVNRRRTVAQDRLTRSQAFA